MGPPRNIVALGSLLCLVTHSLFSSSFYSGLPYVPEFSAQQNQMNEMTMTAATKQPTTEIIANETAPKRMPLMDSLAELDSLSPMECPKGFVRINDTHIPENINDTTRKIPKIVFQTSRSRCMTPRLYELTNRWRFKGWSYYFYDDDAVMRVLKEGFEEFPHLKLLTQGCIDYGTIKADLWRYLVLWKYGGLYADLDSVPTSNFTRETIQPEDDALFVVETFFLLSQYFMSASPKHPLMFYSIQRSLLKLLDAFDTGRIDASLQTGPHALHAGFMQFMRDAGVDVMIARTNPVHAGLFVGTNNRSAKAIGIGGKQSNQYVVRDEIGLRDKVADYKKMGMTHNQKDKNTPSGHSCFSALYQGFINNEKKKITQ